MNFNENDGVPPPSTLPYSVVRRLRFALRSNLTRVWPTRHKELCPPAMAGLLDGECLELPEVLPGPALVLFLPDTFAPHIERMVQTEPTLRVHPDIGLQCQAAYLSWSAPPRYLPRTVWVALDDLWTPLGFDGGQAKPDGAEHIQMLMVCGDSIAFGGITGNAQLRARAAAARQQCVARPGGYSDEELAKAKFKAERYSERPWLFMPYELQNGRDRLCVSWAPLRRLSSRADA